MPQDYIANCIHRALMECAPSKFYELSKEFANAIRLASEGGTGVAHSYLQEVMRQAENGAYK
jgi:hypothetical protein